MTLAYKGLLALGGTSTPLSPLVVSAMGDASIAIAAAIDGAAAVNAQLTIAPPDILSILAQIDAFLASCSAGISFGAPSVSFDIAGAIQLVANLNASLGLIVTLEALLALPISIGFLGFVGNGFPGLPGAIAPLEALLPFTSAILIVGVPTMLPPVIPPTLVVTQLEAFFGGQDFPGLGLFSNLGDLMPVVVNAFPQAVESINYQLGLATQMVLHPKVTPPTLAATITAVKNFRLGLLPKVGFALSATARIVADLQARFGALAQLGLALNRQDARFFVYRYDGSGTLSTELTNEIGPTAPVPNTWSDRQTSSLTPCIAAVLATGDPVSQAAMYQMFAGAA